MKKDALKQLAVLIERRNALEADIAAVIGRPAFDGHIAEFIASEVFAITLESSAANKGFDGRFNDGDLGGRTVNIKWRGKNDRTLNLSPIVPPLDFYLVLAAAPSPPAMSRGAHRPWLLDAVFFFDAPVLVRALVTRGIKVGTACGVTPELWREAEVFPTNRCKHLHLGDGAREVLSWFTATNPKNIQSGIGRQSEQEQLRSALIAALSTLTPSMKAVLRERKAEGLRLQEREDLVWQLLLQSFATMGNSRGWAGLFDTPGLAAQVSYASLCLLEPDDRRLKIEMVLRKATVRRPAQKAIWLANNFASIEKAGGIESVTKHALSLQTRDEKYRFMDAFQGIGPKYARNVWMDIYDPLFRDAIAVDERIQSISKALGYSFPSYEQHEQFYRDIAQEVSLEPWEVDRLLYGFKDHFLAAIRHAQPP